MSAEGEATQEARMRRWLVSQGYHQPYGTTDAEIRRRLGITGKCADFVGYHPGRGMWLIAESKGGNIDLAEEQLTNTLHGLLFIEPEAIEAVELWIYMSQRQYEQLLQKRLSGYSLQEGFLGTMNEEEVFQLTLIEGIRIRVVGESQPC